METYCVSSISVLLTWQNDSYVFKDKADRLINIKDDYASKQIIVHGSTRIEYSINDGLVIITSFKNNNKPDTSETACKFNFISYQNSDHNNFKYELF